MKDDLQLDRKMGQGWEEVGGEWLPFQAEGALGIFWKRWLLEAEWLHGG